MNNTNETPTSSGTRSSLSPLQVPKASDVLAKDMRERILRGEFPEGTSLPPERELVAQTEMSRTTVREALRILEVQGLVQIRTGRSGGAFVCQPDKEAVANSVDLLIRGRKVKLADLLETREAIEPACARLAAKHRTSDDLKSLDLLNDRIAQEGGSLADFLQANVDWHIAVAAASQNELLSGMMLALSRSIFEATNNQGFVDETVRETTARAHRSVTRAIREKDQDAAVRRMTRHVHSYAEAVVAVEDRTEIQLSEH